MHSLKSWVDQLCSKGGKATKKDKPDNPNKPPKDDGTDVVIGKDTKTIHIHVNVNVYNNTKQKKNREAVGFKFTITNEEGEVLTMTPVTLHVDKQLTVTIANPVDSKGRPAKIDGQPSWSTPDGGPVGISPSADGKSCVFNGISPSPDGTVAQVVISGDADLGAGVKTITEVIEVTVLGAEAVGFAVSVSPETDV